MPPELTTVDWIAVRHAYESTEQPVEDICLARHRHRHAARPHAPLEMDAVASTDLA